MRYRPEQGKRKPAGAGCAAIGLVLHGRTMFPSRLAPSARFSYTLYLIHVPVLLFTYGVAQKAVQGNLALAFFLGAIVAVACIYMAMFLSRVLERPYVLIKQPGQ